MPKAPTARTTQRAAPYNLRNQSNHQSMATQILSPYAPSYPDWQHQSTYDQRGPYDQMIPMSTYMHPMSIQPSPTTPHELSTHDPKSSRHQPKHSQGQPWTEAEDSLLFDAKRRGLQWDAIHKQYFPTKSGNACRKRHERLEQKRRGTDWDEERLTALAMGYKDMRAEIWQPLARRLGEKWEHVEKVCMQEGVKPLLNKASFHARHVSNGSSRSANTSGLENQSPHDQYEDHDHDDSGYLSTGSGRHRGSTRTRNSAIDPGNLQNTLHPPRYA